MQVMEPTQEYAQLSLQNKELLFKSFTETEFKQLLQELCNERKLETITENGEPCYRLPPPTETDIIKNEILSTMKPGQTYLISELLELNPKLAEYPSQKVFGLMRWMVMDDVLNREMVRGKAYFSLLQRQHTERPEYTSTDRPPTATQIANAGIKEVILETMVPGQSYLISKLLELNPKLAEYPPQKIVALIRELVREGELERKDIRGKAYFSLV